jgi:hypothetical protein
MSFSQPYNYDPMTGRWYLEIQKTPKDIFSQCGIKITIDPGIPTGESGAFYKPDEKSGMMGANIEFRCFDNLAGWTSAVVFDFNTFSLLINTSLFFSSLYESPIYNILLQNSFTISPYVTSKLNPP